MSYVDVRVQDAGSLVILYPETPAAAEWVVENVSEDRAEWCGGFAAEPRYAREIIAGMRADGLEVGADA